MSRSSSPLTVSADAARTMSIVSSWDEGSFYDPAYAGSTPKFRTTPSRLLVEAAERRKPGKALDVAMGQGRNSVYVARLGWEVTGFDASKEGRHSVSDQKTPAVTGSEKTTP